MADRRILELSLDRLCLNVAGTRTKGHGKHIVTARLIWPRPMIASKVAVQTVELVDGELDLSSADWTKRILFKEVVQGPFGVELSVSERLTRNELTKFINFMSAVGLKLLGGELGQLVESTVGSGLLEAPFKYIAKQIGAGGKSPALVASGMVSLTAEPWEAEVTQSIEVAFCAPTTVSRTTRTRRQGRTTTKRRTFVREGADNGAAALSARVYG